MTVYQRERYNAPPQPPPNGRLPDWLREEMARIHRGIPFGTVIDLRDFGARLNGKVSDAAALRGALNASEAGALPILCPPGVLAVDSVCPIVHPGTRLVGANGGTFRANDTGSDGDFAASRTAIVGMTAGMTVLRCSGTDDDGVTIMQGGPLIENIAFFDDIGREAGTIGDMTLLEIRIANRWRVQNCGFYFASRGAYITRMDTDGDSEDCAWWTMDGNHFSACGIGIRHNAFTGRIVGGSIGSCDYGIYADREDVADGALNGVRVQDIKFDIRDPVITGSPWSNGVGVFIGEVSYASLRDLIFESQPNQLNNLTPSTTAIKIDGANNRVKVSGGYARQVKFGIDCRDCERLEIDGFIGRTPSSTIYMPATVRIIDCEQVIITGGQASESSNPPYQYTADADELVAIGYHGDLEKITELTGTVTAAGGTGDITGTGTLFTTELAVGATVRIVGVDYVVNTITDDTHANMTTNVTAATDVEAVRILASHTGALMVVDAGTMVSVLDYDGTTTVSQNQALEDKTNVFDSGAAQRFERSTGTAVAVAVRISADSNNRLQALANGELRWGDGTNTPETTSNWKRLAASVLATDGVVATGVVSPAQITSDQNDYAPTGGVVGTWRLSSDASRNITGIASGLDRRQLCVINVGAQNIVLQNQNAGSAEASRIITGTGADITIAPDDVVNLWYDGTTARWRVTSHY